MKYAQAKKTSKRRRKSLWLIIVLLVFVTAGGTASAYLYHRHKDAHTAKTTSKAKTAQNDYTGGDDRKPQESGGTSQGGAKDNKGDTTTPTPGESSITSSTGVLTVLGISNNSLLKSGDTLHGTVSDKAVTQVQFRVIDNNVGVLGQGQLSVVNGTYSGALSFTPHASTGRLDVYTFDAAGSETNNIEIPVRFN